MVDHPFRAAGGGRTPFPASRGRASAAVPAACLSTRRVDEGRRPSGMDRFRDRPFFQAGPAVFAAAHRRVRERGCRFAEAATDEFNHGRSLALLLRPVTPKPRQLPVRFFRALSPAPDTQHEKIRPAGRESLSGGTGDGPGSGDPGPSGYRNRGDRGLSLNPRPAA